MVVHVLGTPLRGKNVLTYGLANAFYGLGFKSAQQVCSKLGFYPQMRVHQLTEQNAMALSKELSEMTLGAQLLSQVRSNIKLKRETGSYAGMRHSMGLPVHGQRTKTNAKTARKLNRIERRA